MRTRSSYQLRSIPTVAMKKLRSELPRRRRARISPIVKAPRDDKSSGFSVDSTSLSCFGGEASCQSSRVSTGSGKKPSKAVPRKRKFGESEILEDLALSRSSCGGRDEPEVSESSCVESNCFSASNGGFGANKRSKQKNKRGKRSEIAKAIEEEEKEDSKEVAISEISCVENSNDLLDVKKLNGVVSSVFGAEEKPKAEAIEGEEDFKAEQSVPRNLLDKNLATVSNSESTIDQRPAVSLGGIDSEYLACTENFAFESPESVYSEIQSEIFPENSDLDFSDYTPSLFFDSGSEFSERSDGDSSSSATFSLLLRYRAEFWRSTSPQDAEVSKEQVPEYLKFEDEADEESYQMLRSRENRVAFLRDYIDYYSSTTSYGGTILHQRRKMVNWMIQNCKDLHQETIFLAVSLLDRFLSKGFFKSKRMLQIVGIACLTLATRIEENQPYNSVRTWAIYVGKNIYSRCEVVAMEWLVQEVLNFQCFLPTVFNFLWFYLKAAKASKDVEKRVKYLSVMQLSDTVQTYLPSTVAAAVVILASLENKDSVHNVMETHIRTKGDALSECIQNLEQWLAFV